MMKCKIVYTIMYNVVMVDKIIQIFLNRIYPIVFQLMAGVGLAEKNKWEKVFFIAHVVFFIWSIYVFFCYRNAFSVNMISFDAILPSSEPYDHWFISVVPSIFDLIYKFIITLFSFFAELNLKSFLKLLFALAIITIIHMGLIYVVMMFSNFYLVSLGMTVVVNLMGILTLLVYVSCV
jgi:hypothetical protein